jgi:hypothetical protein
VRNSGDAVVQVALGADRVHELGGAAIAAAAVLPPARDTRAASPLHGRLRAVE